MVETPPLHLEYYERLRQFDRHGALALADEFIARTGDVEGLYVDVLVPAMVHAGREWELDRISVAHEHYISEVTRELIRRIGSRLWVPAEGPVAVACCAPGERHVLGLMMVCDMLRVAGFEVHSLGEGAPIEAVRDYVREVEADFLCLSCALVTHLPEVRELIDAARQARPGLVVLVGGRAFEGDPERALSLGADHFASDVREVRQLLPRVLGRVPR